MTKSSEQATYLTDHWTLEDAPSFSDFRPALENIIRTAETPLTVGIFGPWGSGKTSLMRMLRDQFESEGVASVRTVWFTAWKYDRHEVLWRAFILRVLDALYPREDKPKGLPREDRPILQNPNEKQRKLIHLLERLEESVYQAVDWEEIGRRAVNWWQFIGHTGKAGVEKETIKLIPEGRLVIFVDDLDRCLPEKAIQVLEAIKLFLEVPGTVFVLAWTRT